MRRSQKLVLMLGGASALLITGIGSVPDTHASGSPSEIAALQAQRAALVAELAALQPGLNVAGGQLNSAESAYGTQQQKVLAEQSQLDQLNGKLAALNNQLMGNQATSAQDKAQLAKVIRATWEATGNDQMLAAILSANDFQQAMDRLKNATQVSAQVTALVQKLANEDAQITQDESQLNQERAQAEGVMALLSADSGRLLTDLMNRNDAFNALNGPARQIAAQIANIDNQIAAYESPPSVGSGACGNSFAYGYCTWYVATRRCIPWGGDAAQWWGNARGMGYKEGSAPVPGAVAVWLSGQGGAFGDGHVAYVEAVGPADGIPSGSFKISEMNWNGGWDRVDYRVLSDSGWGGEGFIYDR